MRVATMLGRQVSQRRTRGRLCGTARVCRVAGEANSGSLFYPMTVSPRSVGVPRTDASRVWALALPLEAMEDLHLNQVYVARLRGGAESH